MTGIKVEGEQFLVASSTLFWLVAKIIMSFNDLDLRPLELF